VYDGDGNRVQGLVGGVTTAYVGNWYEWSGSTTTAKKYYYAGGLRIAMRTGSSTLNFLLGDHLGSTSITADSAGLKVAEIRYKAWGESRYATGATPTTMQYTGQRHESGLGGPEGLYYYGARWYDPAVGRFVQADTVVSNPGNPQSFNRYSYVLNNPLLYIDPSGHTELCDAACEEELDEGWSQSPLPESLPQSSSGDDHVADAISNYNAVVELLGHIPTVVEFLALTAQAEFAAYAGYPTAIASLLEALVRQYLFFVSKGTALVEILLQFEAWYNRAPEDFFGGGDYVQFAADLFVLLQAIDPAQAFDPDRPWTWGNPYSCDTTIRGTCRGNSSEYIWLEANTTNGYYEGSNALAAIRRGTRGDPTDPFSESYRWGPYIWFLIVTPNQRTSFCNGDCINSP
jgi:RHS repeat-associated protein